MAEGVDPKDSGNNSLIIFESFPPYALRLMHLIAVKINEK